MRQVVDREAPVEHRGAELSLPFDGPGAIGEGKALKSILHPAGRVEIWIASGGPMNTALAAEVADGWLPMGYGSDGWSIHGTNLEQGWARRGGRPDSFEIMGNLTIEVTDDVQAAISHLIFECTIYRIRFRIPESGFLFEPRYSRKEKTIESDVKS